MPLDLGRGLPDDGLVELKRALKGLMVAVGMTQDAIEAATGINQGRVSKITNENAVTSRPTLTEILLIEAACGAKPGFVLAAAGLTSVEGTRLGADARAVGTHTGTGPSSPATPPPRSRRRR